MEKEPHVVMCWKLRLGCENDECVVSGSADRKLVRKLGMFVA